ncbi:MAG: zf-TFIIB domain-containing protein [Pseudomonadota bacterium]
MKCPVDGATLIMTERAGIEIDYCPVCRGVWLDRGELDKIIERVEVPEPVREEPTYAHEDSWSRRDEWDDRRDYKERSNRRRPKRRESLLSELFDLFD